MELRGITKSFGAVRANDGIDLDLMPGEIHGILGANGAGKSTLMSILAGSYTMDSGSLLVRGAPARFRSPADALRAGIGMVHQHVMLIPSLTVAENLAVGDDRMPWVIRQRRLVERASALARRLGFRLPPTRRVAELSMAERQQVEILRNLARDVAVLILDEPTAVLAPQEAEGLFSTLRTLAADGASLVFISHKLDEVLAIANRITVLRDGRVVHTADASRCAPDELIAYMMGREEEATPPSSRGRMPHRPAIELGGVGVTDQRGLTVLVDVSLCAGPGEILGIAGLAGAGQTVLAEVMAGLQMPSAGSVIVDGEDLTGCPARVFRSRGVRYIPGDRRDRGLAPDLAVAENAALTWLGHRLLGGGPWLSRQAVWRFGADMVRSEGIEPADPGRPARLLSGGNMQKLTVGRETRETPRVLIAEYPLRGLDVCATRFVRARLHSLAAAGTAVVLISEDLDELLSLCDRIAVLVRGRVVAHRLPAETTRLELGLAMVGQGLA